MKNTLKGMNSRLGDKEECTADLEDAVMEVTQTEQKEKCFWFKIMEKKEVCSSTLVRAPKSQLAVEQPSTGGHWNLLEKKKDTTYKDKEATRRWQKGHEHDKIQSQTHWVGNLQSGEQ